MCLLLLTFLLRPLLTNEMVISSHAAGHACAVSVFSVKCPTMKSRAYYLRSLLKTVDFARNNVSYQKDGNSGNG